MNGTNHIEVLREVIHWAESRCPCKEETPDPCTLCGATVAEGTCKAVESIFPRDLLRDLRDALSARASAGEGGEPVAWRYRYWDTFGWRLTLYKPAFSVGDEGTVEPLYTAAPQPAQAGAGGGVRIKTKGPDDFASHVCPAESSAVWNACVYEHNRIAEGLPPILSSTEVTPASPATRLDGATQCNACGGWNKPGCEPCCASPATGEDPCIECGADTGEACYPNCCTAPQPAAAQGGEWVMMPRKMTTAMWKAWEQSNQVSGSYQEDYDAMLAAAPQPQEAPVPVRIDCPQCTAPHVDEGEWATRPHKTHQCQACGHEWRPFPYATVGTPPAQATVKESLTVHPAHGDGEGEQALRVLRYQAERLRTNYGMDGAAANIEEAADALAALATRPIPEAQEAARVTVTKQGVSFGPNCWFSHEQITGRTAECLNSGKGGVIANQYMAWVDAALALPAQGEGKA